MTRAPRRAHLVVLSALLSFAVGYALPAVSAVPNLYYDPIAREFLVGERPGPIPMGYLGQIAWGLCFALAGGVIAFAFGRRAAADAAGDGRAASLVTAWALSALLLAGAWLTWNNWP